MSMPEEGSPGGTAAEADAPKLSVVVPTFNERENLPRLAEALFRALDGAGVRGELVVVDDDSPDGTAEAALEIAGRDPAPPQAGEARPGEEDRRSSGGTLHPVHVLVRRGRKGLSSAVLEGVAAARAPVVCVMDADLSHPPEAVPLLYYEVLSGADIAVGSRLVEGGGVEDWPLGRRLISKGATLLARPLTPVHDPMSGFFCFRRSLVRGARLEPEGYKILLEILARCDIARAVEVPYIFRDRRAGRSKLSGRVMRQYLRHLLRLYASRVAG
jgi:dolichol-phosphate mannosyltransferase